MKISHHVIETVLKIELSSDKNWDNKALIYELDLLAYSKLTLF